MAATAQQRLNHVFSLVGWIAFICVALARPSSLEAQPKTKVAPSNKSAQFKLPDALSGLGGSQAQTTDQITMSATMEWNAAKTAAQLHVTATMAKGWHVYSMSQKAGGPMPSRIELEPSNQFELAGSFVADKAPQVRRVDFYEVPLEEHYEQITWTAPLRLQPGLDADKFEIRGRLLGQVCHDDGGCIPLKSLDTRFTAKVVGTVEIAEPTKVASTPSADRTTSTSIPSIPVPSPDDASTNSLAPAPDTLLAQGPPVAAAAIGRLVPDDVKFQAVPAAGYRAGPIHVSMKGQVAPASTKAGEDVTLTISAAPDLGWHIYAYAKKDPALISKPFLLAVSEPAGWSIGEVVASAEPTVKQSGLAIEPEQRYHERPVDWQVKVRVPAATPAGEYQVRGMIGYQTCSDTGCDQPAGAYFSATVKVGAGDSGVVPLQFAAGKYSAVAKFLAADAKTDAAAVAPLPNSEGPASIASDSSGPRSGSFDLSRIEVEESANESTAYILAVAFAGGFLLNFMPCVLPVIGLKIMSFVQQAGANRGRVFLLNVWYSLGMLTIFLLLALLASAASLGLASKSFGWGEQFNFDGFTIPLLCVVFVMGLSFIGVWEIPIPGFVGSGKTGELARSEGLAGAFLKGIVTTILATPCSGPGLATALTWSATKPTPLVFLVFTCMGLGMALPYLLIGAFPRLIRFLPKPGAWMETFKQLMGFVLMGTVVYMFSLVSPAKVVPTLALIFALWASCWWIGRVPVTAEFGRKSRAWGVAAVLAGIVGWFGFFYEFNRDHDLAWEPFSITKLEEHIAARRTVMVDFTAAWCPTCKVLERSVLNTQPIHQVVEKNDVVTLVADWSDEGEEIGEVLEALGSKQLPVIAIFPAANPYRPKKLTGAYTRRELINKLNDAGPSESPRLAESR